MKFIKRSLLYWVLVIITFSCNHNQKPSEQIKQISQKSTDSLLLHQLNQITKELSSPSQWFKVSTENEQELTGLNGTIIIIQKECFDASEIVVELRECYSKMDLITNALSTITSDGKLLESQGMLFLNVTDKQGNVLKPKVGKLNVKVPVEPEVDCKFFNGEKQNGVIVWKENPSVKISKVNPTEKREKIRYPYFVISHWRNLDTIRDTLWRYHYKEVVASMNAFYTMFNPNTLGWYNLDRYEESERVDFVFNNTIEEASIVLMIPHELNTVVHCAPKMEYNETGLKINMLPDLNADFLFLRLENNLFYYDIVKYQKDGSKTFKIQLETIGKEDLKNLLKQRYGKKFTNEVSV